MFLLGVQHCFFYSDYRLWVKNGSLLKSGNFYSPNTPYKELCIFNLYKPETIKHGNRKDIQGPIVKSLYISWKVIKCVCEKERYYLLINPGIYLASTNCPVHRYLNAVKEGVIK